MAEFGTTATAPQINPQGGTPQPAPTTTTPPAGATAAQTPAASSPFSSFFGGKSVDSGSFTGLLGQIGETLKFNNDLATNRQLLLKHLYDSPLTPDELQKLPKDIQSVVQSGNKDNMELQVRVLNDQLQGRASTLSKSISALTDGYQQAQANTKNAMSEIITYAEATGKPIADVVKALAPIYGVSVTDQVMKNLESLGVAVKPLAGQLGGSYTGSSVSDLGSSLVAEEGSTYTTVNSKSGALGKYQIMPKFWFSSIGLDPNNPADVQTFLNSPSTQDSLFNKIISNLSTQYNGDPAKIAAAYFGGAKGAAIVGTPAGDTVTDGNESVNQYVSRVLGRLSVDASAPSPTTGNIPDPLTGLSSQAIYQDALDYLYTGGSIQQYVGGLSSGIKQSTAKTAIANKAAAVAQSLGITFPQAQSIYKANSSAIKQNTERVARVDSITNSVINQIPRLATLADQINQSGVALTESDLQASQADIERRFGSSPAANYIELVQTIRSDYAANQAALAGSRGGEFFAKSAVEAIPVGLTGSQYLGIKDTMVLSAKNIKDGVQQTIQGLLDGVNGSGTSSFGSSDSSNNSGASTLNADDVNHTLTTHAGSDGYVSPDDWGKMETLYINSGGTASEFNNLYGKYKNPSNPNYR